MIKDYQKLTREEKALEGLIEAASRQNRLKTIDPELMQYMTEGLDARCALYRKRHSRVRYVTAVFVIATALSASTWFFTPPPTGTSVDIGSLMCRTKLIKSVDNFFLT